MSSRFINAKKEFKSKYLQFFMVLVYLSIDWSIYTLLNFSLIVFKEFQNFYNYILKMNTFNYPYKN